MNIFIIEIYNSFKKIHIHRWNYFISALNFILFILSEKLFFSWLISINAISNISLMEIVSYYGLSLFAISFITSKIALLTEEEVKRDIIGYRLRYAVNYFWHSFCRSLSESIASLISLGLPFIIFLFLIKNIMLPKNSLILILLSLFGGFVINFTLNYAIGLIAFSRTNISGIIALNKALFLLFSGMMLPLKFYPSFLQKIVSILPYKYIIYSISAATITSRYEFIHIVSLQCIYATAALIITMIFSIAQLKRYRS